MSVAFAAQFERYLIEAIEKASNSVDILSFEPLEQNAKRYSLETWKNKTLWTVSGVGFATGMVPGVFSGGTLAAMDIAYLFASAGRACFGIGHILGREVDRKKDLKLILACWSGVASSVGTVAAGKIAIKAFGKVGVAPAAGIAAQILAKTAFKGGAKLMSKIAPKAVAKVAGQLVGKAGSTIVPVVGGLVSAGISYWVANSLLNAAESYYRNEYVQLDDPDICVSDLAEGVVDGIWTDSSGAANSA